MSPFQKRSLILMITTVIMANGLVRADDTKPVAAVSEARSVLTSVPFARDEAIYPGDDVITISNTPLIGEEEKVLLTLSRGLPLVVRETHQQWVLVDVQYQGQPVPGWVDRRHLRLISPETPGLLHPQLKDIPKRLEEMQVSSAEHLSRGDFLKSLETCSAALKMDPSNAQAYYRRGHCQQMLEDYQKAIADFDQALTIDSKFEQALLARGDARFSLNDYEKAMSDYERALQLNPRSAGAHYMRGRCWYQKGDFDKAIGAYNAAITIEPEHSWALAHRGDAHFAQDNFDAALADLDKATQIDATFDWAIARRGDVWLFGKHNVDRALADYTFAHILNPRNSWAVHQRGHCLEQKRDFARAIIDYEEAVRLDPDYWDFQTNLAWTLATCPENRVRDGRRAIELASNACQLTERKNSFALAALAAASAEVGDFSKATELIRKAIDLNSEQFDIKTAESMLEAFRNNQPFRETVTSLAPFDPATKRAAASADPDA